MWLECQFLDTEVDSSKPWHQYVVFLNKILYLHCISRLTCKMSTRWDNIVKGVQCYEHFGGIALKNHAFFKVRYKTEIHP